MFRVSGNEMQCYAIIHNQNIVVQMALIEAPNVAEHSSIPLVSFTRVPKIYEHVKLAGNLTFNFVQLLRDRTDNCDQSLQKQELACVTYLDVWQTSSGQQLRL